MSWKTIKPFSSNKGQSSDIIISSEILITYFKRAKEILICCKKSQYSKLRRI